mgnify:CR=1 FL=1
MKPKVAGCMGMFVGAHFVLASSAVAHGLFTPCGTYVGHTHPSPDWTSAEKAAINALEDSTYPQAIRIGDPTRSYNCHSYVWGTSAEWFDYPTAYISAYVEDANGTYLTFDGCITTYPTHSAIIDEDDTTLLRSKWGSGSLMKHPWNHLPAYGTIYGRYIRTSCGNHEDCDN